MVATHINRQLHNTGWAKLLVTWLFLLMTLAAVMAGGTASAQSPGPGLERLLKGVAPAEVVPGAERFGPVEADPPLLRAYRGDEVVGYVFLNSDYVNSVGYSGKPIHIVVGIDREGTIVGAKLVEHHEPIVLVGIPEQKVIDAISGVIGFNPAKAVSEGRDQPHIDIVSGATVTVLVMAESITRSAARAARAVGVVGAGEEMTAAGRARLVNPEAGEVTNWETLVGEGAVRRLSLTVGQVNEAFAKSGDEKAAARPQSGDPRSTFIDLYAALISQPAIGRSLLGESEYQAVTAMLQPGQNAILVAGDGLYSFKGSGYVRGGIFDRIEAVQGSETIRFRDKGHRRIADIAAEGAPDFREIGVFLVPEGFDFNPAEPWQIRLLVQRATGALEKAFVTFDLPYELPDRYLMDAPQAAAPPEPPIAASEEASAANGHAVEDDHQNERADDDLRGAEPAGGQPSRAERHHGDGEEGSSKKFEFDAEVPDGEPLWQRIWTSKALAIGVLIGMLAVLTLIFFFQDFLVKREVLYDRVRLLFLAVTLFWLGWVAQAQLSVVNILTFASALRTDFQWSYFMMDPMVFILWFSVAAALLFWGRGPFCGWLCPFGALQELANRAAKALKVPQLKIPWAVHERLWPIKYIVFLLLFGVSLSSLAFAERLAEVEPFKTAIILRFMREWWFVAFALALLGAGLFVERFFCRYLCPLGAALAIPGRLRMFDWLKRYRECGNPCMRCFKECPVEAIHPEGQINPNECISCLHCQVLYHHEKKCPVMIQKRIRREKLHGGSKGSSELGIALPAGPSVRRAQTQSNEGIPATP